MSNKVNLIIEAGTTFSSTIDLNDTDDNPLELTHYTPTGQVRKTYSSLTAVDFSASKANNEVTIALSANTTADIEPGRYVYDVILTHDDGSVVRILEGIATVTPRVTQ